MTQENLLHYNIRHGALDGVLILISFIKLYNRSELNLFINSRGKNGCSPLQLAVIGARNDIVKLLLSQGADITLRSDFGNSVLHSACASNNLEIVKTILKYLKLNFRNPSNFINYKNLDGVTAMHIACAKGYKKIVVELLDAIPKKDRLNLINCKDENGLMPLHYCTIYHRPLISKLLLKNDADYSSKSKFGPSVSSMMHDLSNQELCHSEIGKHYHHYNM